jgi:hypothetical protein
MRRRASGRKWRRNGEDEVRKSRKGRGKSGNLRKEGKGENRVVAVTDVTQTYGFCC